MMRNGQVFELPMQALHTTAIESSSLPTPMARDYKGDSVAHSRNGKIQVDTVERILLHSGQVFLTPQVDDSKNTGHNQDRRPTLASQVWSRKNQTNWGKFEPAIRRWEKTLDREAPEPTKPDGKDGAHRLSSKFTEWMMGLPEGWITETGISRSEEIKACGNGVVPQQAELALRILMEGVQVDSDFTQVNFPTPTVSDLYTGSLKSSQQKEGSMHSVTLPQAVKMVSLGKDEDERNQSNNKTE